MHCHVCASSTNGCAFVGSSAVSLFKPSMSGHKCKSSADVAGTAKECRAVTMAAKVKIIVGVEQGDDLEIGLQEDFMLCITGHFLRKP